MRISNYIKALFLAPFFAIFIIPMALAYQHDEGFIKSTNNVQLYYEAYHRDSAKKAILFIQGRTEFTKKYLHLTKDEALGSLGHAFYFYDVRGQGQSDGHRAHIDHYDQHVEDLRSVVQHVQKKYKQIIFLAHSTGALIAIRYLQAYPTDRAVQSAVMTSPLLGINTEPWPGVIVKNVAKLFVQIGWGKRRVAKENNNENRVTHDEKLYQKHLYDPLVVGPPTYQWVNSSYEAIENAHQQIAKIQAPVLMLSAGDDAYVKPEVTHKYCRDLSRLGKTCIQEDYPKMLHELLNEVERPIIFSRIRTFLTNLNK